MPDSAVRSPEPWHAFAPGSARLVDAILAALLVVRLPAPGTNLPIAQLAIILLVVVALFRRPVRRFPAWFGVLSALAISVAVVASVLGEVDFFRRLGNIALLFVMAGFLASGRIHVTSAIKGVAIALVLNIGLFFARLAPDTYGGVLTGFIGDKNVAGLFHAIIPFLLVLTVPPHRRVLRAAILVIGAGALVLTDSRTSMAAYAMGLVWFLLAPRLSRMLRVLLGVVLAVGFWWADQNLSTFGAYSVSRAGSDALRARIDEAAAAKAALAPWYGEGLGTAVADIDGVQWYFHNSYDALRVEGGYLLMVVVVVLYLVAGLGLTVRATRDDPRHGVAAATLVILLCATRLGEVFFAGIGLFVVGVGTALVSSQWTGIGLSGTGGTGTSDPEPVLGPVSAHNGSTGG